MASVWSVEDARTPLDNADEVNSLSDDEIGKVAEALLRKAEDGLENVLGQRGNDYLSDAWSEHKDEIMKDVVGGPRPG